MCRAVLSNLLNLMRGGTSGSGIEPSWEEESTEFASVDINLLWQRGTSGEACWNEASLELPSMEAKPLPDSTLGNAPVWGETQKHETTQHLKGSNYLLCIFNSFIHSINNHMHKKRELTAQVYNCSVWYYNLWINKLLINTLGLYDINENTLRTRTIILCYVIVVTKL